MIQMRGRKVSTIRGPAEYQFRRAMEAQGVENPERVLEYFDQALSIEPGYAIAWNEKANFLDLMGRLDDALQCYDMALKIDPGNSEVWFNKGLTLQKLGKENEAFSCINKGIDLACGG
jgi:tetratricopeptide (TPR) repeat protein